MSACTRARTLHPFLGFLADLCEDIGRAYGCPDGITTHLDRAEVPTDIAIPLALIVNELLTNAVKHAGPPCKVSLQVLPGELLKLTIQDAGSGPPAVPRAPGLGTRMVEALSLQLGATVATSRAAAGFVVEVTLPSPKPVQ